jgi:hypothetical protein
LALTAPLLQAPAPDAIPGNGFVLSPDLLNGANGMGEYGPAASNKTKAGRAENRRVEAKVPVNKGIAGN